MSSPSPPSGLAPLSVLIVDDDDLVADYIDLNLSLLGCATRIANDGEAALRMLATADFDLLVTDWQMPRLDGMELVRHVRAWRNAESYLHIAMVTSREDPAVIRAALEAGVDDFLLKPLDEVQLELAVATARRNRTLHRRLKRRAALLTMAHQHTRDALHRVQADLDAAAALHSRLLPPQGRHGGLDLALLYRPALMLGGDTIGAAELPGGGLLFFLIDVCGHGVPAALDSFHLHHRLKGMLPRRPEELAAAAALLNREIAGRGEDGYATMLAGIIHPQDGEAWLIRAGHPPPLLLSGASYTVLEEGGSMPLGWFEDAPFEPFGVTLSEGDRLVVYSDGITECSDQCGIPLGAEGLGDLLISARTAAPAVLADRADQAITKRIASRGLEDDISLLLIARASEEIL